MIPNVRFTTGGYKDNSKELIRAVAKAGAIALRILGFNIRKDAQESIKPVRGEWQWFPVKTGGVRRGKTDAAGKAHKYVKVKTGGVKRRFIWPASPPGSPPYTHIGSKRQRTTEGHLPASILYSLEDNDTAVVIGPSIALLASVGRPHEHAGSFRGRTYPERPFMGPALGQEIGTLPGLLAEQINKQKTIL
jgi:hypothetical protein